MAEGSRTHLRLISGGGDPLAEMHEFALSVGQAFEPFIVPSLVGPDAVVTEPTEEAYLYRTSLESMKRVFLAIAAEKRFGIGTDSEYTRIINRIGLPVFGHAYSYEMAMAKFTASNTRAAKERFERFQNIASGMKASLLLWQALHMAELPQRFNNPKKANVVGDMLTTIDQHADEYIHSPDSRAINASTKVQVNGHIRRGIADFITVIDSEPGEINSHLNNFSASLDRHQMGLDTKRCVIDTAAFSAGALLVASQIQTTTPLKVVR